MVKPSDRLPPPIAVTVGDPAGIGPDIILMAWHRRNEERLSPFLVIGCAKTLATRAIQLGLSVPITTIETPGEASRHFSTSLPLVPLELPGEAVPGKPDAQSATMTIEAIDRAVAWTLSGDTAAIVTAPINKSILVQAGFSHPGHTEYLAYLCKAKSGAALRPVMMIAAPGLKVVPVTIHMPLNEVSSALTRSLIVETIEITATSMRDRFRIAKPRIAVTGLNPHAGESGLIGREEIETIIPAIETLKANGIDVVGPLPADGAFQSRSRPLYDVFVAMYHDQALIPVKTLAFDAAVNVTLGLPIIRTSPDHGTAYDLAGTGNANPESFLASLKLADELSTPAKQLATS